MYYRTVNRGLTITKAGRYAIAFVLILGFFATGSGYNGLYLSLSLGLSMLIISGLLSEKVMKFCEPESMAPITHDAFSPFGVTLRVINHSPNFSGYGLQFAILAEAPKLTVISSKMKSVMMGHQLKLNAGESTEVSVWCEGLSRGLYKKFTVVQRTGYPFGLLIKYKIKDLDCEIRIVPQFDDKLAESLRNELKGSLGRTDSDREFYSHRAYVPGDSLRLVDWKKSSRLNSQWVIKVFESQGESKEVLVFAARQTLINSADEKNYEAFFNSIRTALQVVAEFSRIPTLSFDGATRWVGLDESLAALVEAPQFKDRTQLRLVGPQPLAAHAITQRLELTGASFTWNQTPMRAHG
jgi:hypothetical protein